LKRKRQNLAVFMEPKLQAIQNYVNIKICTEWQSNMLLMVTGRGKEQKLLIVILPQLQSKAREKERQRIVNTKMWMTHIFMVHSHANNWNSSARKVMILHREVNERESDFTASIGWTHCWEKHCGVSQLFICEGGLSLDSEVFCEFAKELHSVFYKDWWFLIPAIYSIIK